LFKFRWKIELFFKWIKQHLRIKAFYGNSENVSGIRKVHHSGIQKVHHL